LVGSIKNVSYLTLGVPVNRPLLPLDDKRLFAEYLKALRDSLAA
jgi:hypothetical protein